jgi:hypothetical protein
MNQRDEFSAKMRATVAARAGYRCSNPHCQTPTSGPTDDLEGACSIGVAAHITAASPGGPRHDPSLTAERRSSIENAIWMCGSCATMIDRDEGRYTVASLLDWKQQAENAARIGMAAGSKYRPIKDNEQKQFLSVGEMVALRALQEEFGCEIKTNVKVLAGEGWLNLDAAVVRGEDLVAIEIYENKGNGIPFFQVEVMIGFGTKLKLHRFRRFVLYVAVVSDGPEEEDPAVLAQLEKMAASASCEVYIRPYRLNPLRAKYSM